MHVVFQKTATKAPLSFLQLNTADLKPDQSPHDVLVYMQELAKVQRRGCRKTGYCQRILEYDGVGMPCLTDQRRTLLSVN